MSNTAFISPFYYGILLNEKMSLIYIRRACLVKKSHKYVAEAKGRPMSNRECAECGHHGTIQIFFSFRVHSHAHVSDIKHPLDS